MASKVSRASDSVWIRVAADFPIPGGFDTWEEYDAWLNGVLASGRHPDEPRPASRTRRAPSEDAPEEAGGLSMQRAHELQRDEDFRVLTHPHNGWTQTGPATIEKTDWAGAHHVMTVGHPEDPVTLSTTSPDGSRTSDSYSNMRSADVAASRHSITNTLLPQLAERGLSGFHNDSNYTSAIKRDEDGWFHRIVPFMDHRGHVWYTYSGGRTQPSVQRTERDHPSLDAAVEHAKTRQDPAVGRIY